jgi:hypothetical protein
VPALAPVLLRLASAIGADGEEALPRLLGDVLAEAARFDAAEIAISTGGTWRRYTIKGDARPIAGADLLGHLVQGGEPMRIDDPSEATPYAETQSLMAERGFGSVLALPFSKTGSPAGGVVLACTFAWSLVGVPMTRVAPLAAMAGIALERSRYLAELEGALGR